MVKLRTACIGLGFMTLIGLVLCGGSSEATTVKTAPENTRSNTDENKFLGRWSSHITLSSGEKVNDGVFDINEVSPARADRVNVLHSLRGGPFTGYIMSYPDRIEIQMPLGDGRVAHYNGVLTAADRVEGRYFVTGDRQGNASGNRSASNPVSGSFDEDDPPWVITKP